MTKNIDESRVEEYLEKVPSVILAATEPFGDKECWALYIAILESRTGLRLTQLAALFGSYPSEIIGPLRKLVDSGLVAKRVFGLHHLGDEDKTYYTSSILGKVIIRALYKSIMPSKPDMIDQD